jgi:hypothetical protein
MNRRLIAFTGYARSGKDAGAMPFIQAGFTRRCFGDIIKKQVDGLVKDNMGFSAFTEVDTQKNLIRPLLETWGDVNYAGVMSEFFAFLPQDTVNTRLCRVAEAREWRRQGGIIVQLTREHNGLAMPPTTTWEYDVLWALNASGLVDIVVVNDSSVEDLHRTLRALFLDRAWPSFQGPWDRPRTIRSSGIVHSPHG